MDNGQRDVGGWWHGSMSAVSISRRRSFQKLHPSGQILTPRGAAHNYYVEVSLAGPLNEKSGMVVNIRDIDGWIDEALQEVPPEPLSVEGLAEKIFSAMCTRISKRGVELKKLRLFESPDYWVDIWP